MAFAHTRIYNLYWVKFFVRLSIFFAFLVYYCYHRDAMQDLMVATCFHETGDFHFNILHIVWLMFMVMMAIHLIAPKSFTMALLKRKPKIYKEVPDYSREKLLDFVSKQNFGAWLVLLSWMILNGAIALLYVFNIIIEADLMMLTVAYFLCDYICILIYCPFQHYMMKNKCCVNCRIYDWGHFMMFTPMLFIHSFFSWSLFFMAMLVLVRWELTYALHPNRFWEGSNSNLKCVNCNDKICQVKSLVRHGANPNDPTLKK